MRLVKKLFTNIIVFFGVFISLFILNSCEFGGHTHEFSKTIIKEATCEDEGIVKFECETCEEEYTEIIPKYNHKYTETIIKSPTCVEDGIKEVVCDNCGHSFQEVIPATQKHEYDEGVIAVEPTCSTSGSIVYSCVICKHSYEEEIAPTNNHRYDAGEIIIDATCSKNGEILFSCLDCEYQYVETIEKNNVHNFPEEGTIISSPNCCTKGSVSFVCDDCGYEELRELDIIDVHNYKSEITKEATCQEEGVKTYTCSLCGISYTESIPIISHNMGDWFVFQESTVYQEGIERRECLDCEFYEDRTIDKIPIVYTIKVFLTNDEFVVVDVAEDGKYNLESITKIGYNILSYKTEDKEEFPLSGIVSEDVVVYATLELDGTDTIEELEERAAAGVDRINITADIYIDRTIYVLGEVNIYTEGNFTLYRAKDFLGDLFVLGEDKDGRPSLLDNSRTILTLGNPELDGILTIDGNKVEEDLGVHGSAIFVGNGSKLEIYDGVIIQNHKKTRNVRAYVSKYGISSPYNVGGAAIISLNGSVIDMYGGLITNNEVNISDLSGGVQDSELYFASTYGGSIYNRGQLNMYGGTISSSKAVRGGAVFNYCTFILYAGTIENNYASKQGGAIYFSGTDMSHMYIGDMKSNSDEIKVKFINNISDSSGGAIFMSNENSLVIYGQTLFEGNAANAGNGGAISSSGVLLLESTKFVNNNAFSKGGAVYGFYGDGETKVRLIEFNNCIFESNKAPRGGAVMLYASETEFDKGQIATFKGCEFINNYAYKIESISIDETTQEEIISYSYGYGAALALCLKSEATVNNCTFSDNYSDSNGGAVYLASSSSMTITNSHFENNSSKTAGGALYVTTANTFKVSNTTFVNNSTADEGAGGGAVYTTKSATTFTDVSFIGNSTLESGGAIFANNTSSIKLENVISENNKANNGGAYMISYSDAVISGKSTILSNEATYRGGAIYVGRDAMLTATDLLIDSNTAHYEGGAMYSEIADVSLNKVTIKNNLSTPLEGETSGGNGGALATHGTTISIENSLFENNIGSGNGGAIYRSYVSNLYANTVLTLNNVEFVGNRSANYGGAIYSTNIWQDGVEYIDTSVSISNSKFIDNHSMTRGGAINSYRDIFVISNTEFIGNDTGASEEGFIGDGGAINAENTRITLYDNSFINNSGKNGGAISLFSGSVIDGYNITAYGNNGKNGGVFYINRSTLDLTNDPDGFVLGKEEIQNEDEYNNAINGGVLYASTNAVINIKGISFLNNHATYAGAIYSTNSSVVSIDDSNFENNLSSQDGGAIKAHNAEVLVQNTEFINNESMDIGGALYIQAATVTLSNVNFDGNKSALYGGAIAIYENGELNIDSMIATNNYAPNCGGVFYVHSSTLNLVKGSLDTDKIVLGSEEAPLEGQTVANNSSKGGVMYVSTKAIVNIDGAIIRYNEAGANGGAIFASNNSMTTIANSSFENNIATSEGGAIYSTVGDTIVEIIGCNFNSNEAKSGGALAIKGNKVTISNSNLTNNYASSLGGAIEIGKDENELGSEVVISDSLFDGNVSESNGGAIYVIGSALEVNKTIISNNESKSTSYGGGGIYFTNSTGTLNEVTIEGNKAFNGAGISTYTGSEVTITSLEARGNEASNSGGFAYMSKSKIILNNNGTGIVFAENKANQGGVFTLSTSAILESNGAEFDGNVSVEEGGAILANYEAVMTIANTTFKNNSSAQGGAILLGSVEVSISDSRFENNSASAGGAIYVNGAKLNITGETTFEGNKALESHGGALAIYKSSEVSISSMEAKNNSAASCGGVFYVHSSTLNLVKGSLDTDKIVLGSEEAPLEGQTVANTASTGGGALYVSNGAIVNVKEATFGYNEAKNNGGAIVVTGTGTMTLDSSLLKGNKTLTTNSENGKGGALATLGTNDVTITNSVFENNTAIYGGAVGSASISNVNISDSTFINNSASNGGAVYVNGAIIEITSSEFENNNSENGGAIYLEVSNISLNEIEFNSNSAQENGGAIYVSSGSVLNDQNSVYSENTATKGGAIYLVTGDQNAHAEYNSKESTFEGNSSTSYGGAICGYNYSLINLENVEFTNNKAINSNGGAVWTYTNSQTTITGIEAKGNSANSGGFMYTRGNLTINGGENVVNNFGGTLEGEANTANTNGGVITILGFETGSVDVNINDVNLIGNNCAESTGGAMYISYANVIINSSLFEGNTSTSKGGAIYSTNSNIEINDSTFETNTAPYGGAIYLSKTEFDNNGTAYNGNSANDGSAIYVSQSTVTLNGNEFKNNKANNVTEGESDDGFGTIYITANSVVNDNNSTYIENTAVKGGAIYLELGSDTSAATYNANDTSYISNETSYYGGAICGYNYSLINLENVEFTNNKAINSNGGAVWTYTNSQTTITGIEAKGNSANSGGFMYTRGNLTINGGENVVNNFGGTLEGEANTANTNGGAILIFGYEKSLLNINIDDADFVNNTAKHGGAIYLSSANVTITDSRFEGNTSASTGGAISLYALEIVDDENTEVVEEGYIPVTMNITNSVFERNSSLEGGAIYSKGNSVIDIDINGGSFKNNEATVESGTAGGGAISIYGTNLDINNNTLFEGNKATVRHGGAIFMHSNSVVNISSMTATNNYAHSSGGVFYVHSSTLNLVKGSLETDKIVLGSEEAPLEGQTVANTAKTNGGGVIYSSSNGIINVDGAIFGYNVALRGGAIDITSAKPATISNSRFIGNTSSEGGAINIRANTDVTVNNSTFTSNSSEKGGAILTSGKLIVNNSTFTSNATIETSTADDELGGAICVALGSTNISDSTFINNSAKNGGAVYVGGDSTFTQITSSEFENNNATVGGAIFVTAGTINIEDSLFTSNSSSGGGAIRLNTNAKATITNSQFTSNSSTGNGGAIYVYTGAYDTITTVINGCTFTSNSSTGYGGGMYISSNSSVEINDVIARSNQSNKSGAFIYITTANSRLIINGATISDNKMITSEETKYSFIYSNYDSILITIYENNFVDEDIENNEIDFSLLVEGKNKGYVHPELAEGI